jgi:thiosulfate reductase/polysulfide reductase chain A
MRAVDFITMVDIQPTEGALWADLILPEATYLERYDDILAVKDHPQPFLAIRQPAVPPCFEARGPYWIAQQLAHRLGHTDCFTHSDVTQYLDARLKPLGITFEELARKGIHVLPEQQPFIPDGQPHHFNTPSGKIELYSKTMLQKGYDPIPIFEPVEQPPVGWFRLISGRTPYHTGARTQDLRRLLSKAPENTLWINDQVARAKGLRNGDKVYLQNQDGYRTGPIQILVTPAIRTDVVYMVHGFGSRSSGLKRAHGRGISDNVLSSRYKADPPTGGTGFRVNFVQLVTRRGKGIPGETATCRAQRTPMPRPSAAPGMRPKPTPEPRARPVPGPTKDKHKDKGKGKDTFKVQLEDSC